MKPAKPITCFLVDDDTDDQDIFFWAIENISSSIRCITSLDGQRALESLAPDQNFLPDFIFLDLNMPKINGLQCLKEIKEMNHLNQVPVIIYTTSDNPRDQKETLAMGASSFLTKTSDLDALTVALAEIFNTHA